MSSDFEQLRRISKPLNGGIFFNSDGSVSLLSLHLRHLALVFIPLLFIPAAWYWSWWLLLGVPLGLTLVHRKLVRLKRETGMRIDFNERIISRGEVKVPFSAIKKEDFLLVSSVNKTVIRCIHPRLEMVLPLEFKTMDVPGEKDNEFGREHDERAAIFLEVLWEEIESRRKGGRSSAASAKKIKKKTSAQRKEAGLSLSADKQWMSRHGAVLARAWGLQCDGLILKKSGEDTREFLIEKFKDTWGVTSQEKALAVFSECIQGLASRLLALQEMSMDRIDRADNYKEAIEKAVLEIRPLKKWDWFLEPGPEFLRAIRMLYDKEAPEIALAYGNALSKARDEGLHEIFHDAEEDLIFKSRIYGEATIIGVEGRLYQEYEREDVKKAMGLMLGLFKDDLDSKQFGTGKVLRLCEIKKLYRDMAEKPDFITLENQRIEGLSGADSITLGARNPYVVWDFARAMLIRQMTYSIGWEEHDSAIWGELRPLARKVQRSLTGWNEILQYILLGQAMEGDVKQFGESKDFIHALKKQNIDKLLANEKLRWKLSLEIRED